MKRHAETETESRTRKAEASAGNPSNLPPKQGSKMPTKPKQKNARPNIQKHGSARLEIKQRSWSASSEKRAIVAALEWDFVEEAHRDALKLLQVDRDVYVDLARKIRLEPGIKLSQFLMDLGMGTMESRLGLGIVLLKPRMSPIEIVEYFVRNPDTSRFASATEDVIRRGLVKVTSLRSGLIFAHMPFAQGKDVSLDEVEVWHSQIWNHFKHSVPGLSAL